MKISPDWFKHIKGDEAKLERKEFVVAQLPAWKVMREVLQHRLDSLEVHRISRTLYDSPGWAYMQADINAETRTLRELLSLLTIEE